MRNLAILILSALSLGLLTACGFAPVHGGSNLSSNSASALQNITLIVEDGKDANDKEASFHLNQRLRDRIGVNQGAYTLTVSPSWSRGRLGISSDDVASRYDGSLRAKYTLTDTRSGKVMNTGNVTAVSTYGASEDPYAVIASNNNAVRNVAAEAADRIIFKLAGYFAEADLSKTAP
ncbi:LPS-assembly lipoprotein [Litorimonas taeanensis]|uniref:LPS-assembly lipoprotein n=1 Tax=Litorimonas taeanensis TaxID=568099 RepID=A0A420WEP0_9PROT|nr:LPS assembly lipoprotein LptE [Litorimonas taeanensis]RKQ69447.1 LPS-assembly lipoprotein [Litorimonas taeanensis]